MKKQAKQHDGPDALRLLLVELCKEGTGARSRRFTSFQAANGYLEERLQKHMRFDEPRAYAVHAVWEGGVDFHGTLELLMDEGSGHILERFIQSVLEDEMLLPPPGEDVEAFVSRESFHMRRMSEARREAAERTILHCEGMDSGKYLARKECLLEALAAFSLAFPLVEPVVTEGRCLLEPTLHMQNRSTYYKNTLSTRLKFPLSLAISYAFQGNREKAMLSVESAKSILQSNTEDAPVIDERFTKLGRELYGLTAIDADRLRSILVAASADELPFEDDEVDEFMSRERELVFRDYVKMPDVQERLFLRFYRQSFAYRKIRTGKNRTDITLHAANQVRLYSKGTCEEEIERVILNLDPLAVHQPSYAHGILDYMDEYVERYG